MPITINGSGTITGLSAGGLPDGTIAPADLTTGGPYWDTSGNVGIGTSSPDQLLSINSANTSTNSVISYRQGGTTYGYTGLGQTNQMTVQASVQVNINSTAANPITFLTSNIERARIDSSGNLLVGTTSSTAYQTGNNFVFNTGPAGAYEIVNHTNSASGSVYIGFGYNSTGIGSITQNGTTGVLYNLTSDYRLKNNPVPLTGAKQFVMSLQPKTWDWWDGSGKGVGFIAHEFMEVAKYSGNGEKDAVDADGNPIYQSIQPSSSEVMANIVSLIQEQQAMIEELKAKVAAQAAEIAALKGAQA